MRVLLAASLRRLSAHSVPRVARLSFEQHGPKWRQIASEGPLIGRTDNNWCATL